MPPEFELRELVKDYNPGLFKKKVRSVNGLSCEVHRGEVFGLIGPNGAGKSSTIRLMLGLSKPDSGEVLFRGSPLESSGFRRYIGYLPENPYLYDHLTLDELLDFGAAFSALSQRDSMLWRTSLLERTGMSGARNRALRTFSKGMLQRAGLCLALVRNPDVVVLDEPMSGLDPLGRKMVFDLVSELRGQGKTIFFCSHILNDVERLCDRVAIMGRGVILKTFTRESLNLAVQSTVQVIFRQIEDGVARKLNDLGCQVNGDTLTLPMDQIFKGLTVLADAEVEIIAFRGGEAGLEEIFLKTINGGEDR